LRAAAALARYDPDSQRWAKAGGTIVEDLVSVNPVFLGLWSEEFRPVKARLLAPLASVFKQPEPTAQRSLATSLLADYAADQPQVLADLLMDADETQFAVIYPKLQERGEEGLPLLQGEVDKKPTADSTEEAKEALARRQANAAVALLRMNRAAKIWPLLKHSADPRARTYLIHRLAPLGADVTVLLRRLDEETDVSSRRALILCLGEFDTTRFPAAQRPPSIAKLLDLYRNDPDPGLHAAVEWLLRQKDWDRGDKLSEIDARLQIDDKQLQARKVADKRQWYVNSEGQTFVILDADQPFRMGSPDGEPGRQTDEVPHQQRIGRTFAIASTAVTKAQFRHFQQAIPDVRRPDIEQFSRTDDSPQVNVDWYDAARYCNWLSKNEGLPKEQWCYEPNDQGKYAEGMKPATGYLQRNGYRLPTEAEWEYACRSGSQTSRYYGPSAELLPKYALFLDNSGNRTWPVGMKKPNDYGLFGMLGNTWQWCDTVYEDYAVADGATVLDDSGTKTDVRDKVSRVVRGGSFIRPASVVRCASRDDLVPTSRYNGLGFRAARTFP
jgi:formylglycine-generating enzyme required for sulfatase activity